MCKTTNKKWTLKTLIKIPTSARGQASFTLVEVILAVGILAAFLVQIASVQGNSVYFVEYGRNIAKASWLAKGLMSQVDYHFHTKPFDSFKGSDVEKANFEDEQAKEFTYDVKIEEFPLPISSIIANTIAGGGEDDDEVFKDAGNDGLKDQVDSMVKEFLGEELMKLATVIVYWPEGAQRNFIKLNYLLANHKKISEVLTLIGASSPPATGGNTSGTSGSTGGNGSTGGSGGTR